MDDAGEEHPRLLLVGFALNQFDAAICDPSGWMSFMRMSGDLRDVVHLSTGTVGFIVVEAFLGEPIDIVI